MAWPKGFSGTVNTDIDSAGIGAAKVTGASGAFRLSGWGRAFRAVASQTSYYQFSDTVSDADYRVPFSFFVDSTTVAERIGITVRDTGTNATTGRNFVWFRLRSTGGVSAFLEIQKAVSGTFTLIDDAALPISGNTLYEYVAECVGDQFTLYAADGVTPVIGPVTISDSVLQNAGKVGIYSSGDSTASTAGATDGGGTGSHLVSIDFEYVTADVEATGSPAAVTITAPTGMAQVGGGDVNATGSLPAISITAPSGSISAGASASGSLSVVTISAPTGSADNGVVPVSTGGPGWGVSLRHIQQDDEQVMKLVIEAFSKLAA